TVLILAVILILLPDYIAPVCHGGKVMKCHYMGQANKGAGIGLMLVGAMLLFVKNKEMARGIGVGGILLSLLAVANSAFLIGGCSAPMMSCNTKNIPATYMVCGVLILVQLWFVLGTREKK
ncbi:MAG: DUF4418 family protein, partial [Bacillota bacterium]|nr:DUF4418 family protein [Bacillota bacterium]